MKYLIDPILGLLASLFGLVIHPLAAAIFAGCAWHYGLDWLYAGTAPFLVGVLAVLTARWDAQPDVNGYVRGDLLRIFRLYETKDERLPGDVQGEPLIIWSYRNLGKVLTAMLWLLERNRGMGFSYLFARTLQDGIYLDGSKWGFQELPSGAWRRVWRIGPWWSFGVGNQTTLCNGVMYCRPWFSVKRQHDGKP